MNKDKKITIYLDLEMLGQIERLAKKHDRSKSWIIRALCHNALGTEFPVRIAKESPDD